MNRIWKRVATASLVVAMSVAAAATTVHVMLPRGGEYRAEGVEQEGSASTGEYGFQNTALAAVVKQVGSAPDLTIAAESSIKAVVHIKTQGVRQSSREQMIDPFELFFGRGGMRQEAPRPVVGYGSGVIISEDGYIITNNHVIDNSQEISVTLNDNRTFTAKLIGTDADSDIALLKVEGKNLPTIPFGNSDALRLGEWVLAVGNPFNLNSTVTAGIVSAKSRSAGGRNRVEAFIQTDAAINSGNSGGALVNASGELVGINTMIYSDTGNFAGYSFAVPINMAAKVVSDIKKYGAVQRAFLGIGGRDMDAEFAQQQGLKVNSGVYVGEFSEISAALAAGVEIGDVIVAIGNTPINNFGQLQEQLSRFRPGDVVEMKIDRKGTEKILKVKLKNKTGGSGLIRNEAGNSASLGAVVKPLDEGKRRSYGISYGLLVERVNSGAMKEAGIRAGFILLTINDTPIRSTNDLSRILAQAKASGARRIALRGFYPQEGEMYTYYVEVK
ncbi:Do family serine endopeptidase [Porphyromonas sp. COT-239 OH1446]|uniref:Do family serine endopeptidase n=1 Tax=Porphyromonas sp. COT-239 OH1446 TaxID=1515613 RepID=UPI00052D4A61|nr:Do family serine endopeptidase [Porphyromonas sp. COT-239 OH1446]KGN70044.1 deoxyribonuclease HsdR [Porphyromonas sp. COT-239 OH1446]